MNISKKKKVHFKLGRRKKEWKDLVFQLVKVRGYLILTQIKTVVKIFCEKKLGISFKTSTYFHILFSFDLIIAGNR